MNRTIIYIMPLCLTLFLFSCKDFLSELPTKGSNQPVTTVEQLENLLNDARRHYSPVWEDDYVAPFSSDDIEITTDIYDASVMIGYPDLLSPTSLYYYTFKTVEIENLIADDMWTQRYGAIYNYNLVIENADRVTGDDAQKMHVKADAHFMRAYEMWTLANLYCLPYCEKYMDEPGLPRRNTIDMDENFARMTLRQTYEMIENDLEIAHSLFSELNENPNNKVNIPVYKWRSSLAVTEAFRSRLYLHMGRYEEAAQAAAYALANKGGVSLFHLENIEMVELMPGSDWPETSMWSDAQLVGWQEFFYARLNKNNTMIYQASRSLLEHYDRENDLRFKKFFWDANDIFLMGMQQMICYITFQSGGEIASGITLPEVMLNRAEALLRQANPDIEGAMTLVNDLRDYRFEAGYDGIHLTAADKVTAMRHVLEERRRELPYTYRWYDIRRFSVNEDPSDDVTISRTFYKVTENAIDPSSVETSTLAPGSRRYAVPINRANIENSGGAIVQNTY